MYTKVDLQTPQNTHRTLWGWCCWCCRAAKKWQRWACVTGCAPPTAPSAEVALPREPLLPWLPLWWLYMHAWFLGWWSAPAAALCRSCSGMPLLPFCWVHRGRYTPYWLSVSESSPSDAAGEPESFALLPGPPHMAFLSILFSWPMMVAGWHDVCCEGSQSKRNWPARGQASHYDLKCTCTEVWVHSVRAHTQQSASKPWLELHAT